MGFFIAKVTNTCHVQQQIVVSCRLLLRLGHWLKLQNKFIFNTKSVKKLTKGKTTCYSRSEEEWALSTGNNTLNLTPYGEMLRKISMTAKTNLNKKQPTWQGHPYAQINSSWNIWRKLKWWRYLTYSHNCAFNCYWNLALYAIQCLVQDDTYDDWHIYAN
jgi:hypothetical protein